MSTPTATFVAGPRLPQNRWTLILAVLATALLALPSPAHAHPATPEVTQTSTFRPAAPLEGSTGIDWIDRTVALPEVAAQLAAGAAPMQAGGWQEVAPVGATCGRGTPYKYYVNASTNPEAGIVFLFNGGGACLKDGPAPADVQGTARNLYCMNYTQFTDMTMNTLVVGVLSGSIPYFKRTEPTNPFRDFNYVWMPYCTGDLFAGAMAAPYDYDPTEEGKFEVVHRGHLNVLAVLDDMKQRVPGDVPVFLSGLSAGGLGVIYNFPEVIRRWPRTTLLPDAGITPPHGLSIMAREGVRVAARWGARVVLPDYCTTDDCLSDSLRLLQAHAAFYDGREGRPWRSFGYLEAQQDATLSAYLEIPKCSYELGLKIGRARPQPANLRAWIPATAQHVFVNTPTFKSAGVPMLSWVNQLATAQSLGDLPADAVDPWLKCGPTYLPGLWARQ